MVAANLPLLHPVHDTKEMLWATLPQAPLFMIQKGFTTRTINPDSFPLFSEGAIYQEIPYGLPLRLWIEGAGGLAGVVTDIRVITEGTIDEKQAAAIPSTQEALLATRIRTGTRFLWDTDAPFTATDFPDTQREVTNLFARDPSVTARIDFAKAWVNEWARTLLRISPYAPIILEGFVIGAGFSIAPSAGNDQKAQFFIQEAMLLGRNEWLGYEELSSIGVPVLPIHKLPADNTDILQETVWNSTSLITALDIMPVQGFLLRPIRGTNRSRFIIERETIHPFFRNEGNP